MPLSAASTSKRIRLRIRGIVQGVGFRPFVYQLAARHALGGYVLNDGEGVLIEFEGQPDALQAAAKTLHDSPPPLARIDEVIQEDMALQHAHVFIIRGSETNAATAMVSPDIAICDACRAELLDPANRRYRYALINCTDCGPRYTIIEGLPYDRPNTSMKAFAMCHRCEEEYNDPANRRYHAQPISCFDCGPRLTLRNAQDHVLQTDAGAVEAASRLISEGKIVAVKGLGGFHLVCDATNESAVQTLRERKGRPTKPLAVMFPSLDHIREAADIREADIRLILSKERPIVIVTSRDNGGGLAPTVAPGIDRLGVFLPYTPLHILLLESLERPIVATSANRSEEPILTDGKAVLQKLGHVVDAVLDHDRPIVNACDDSVVMAAEGAALMLRMARGYAPRSMPLPFETPKKILAVGANQKNALGMAFGKHFVLSPHIGDLVSLDAFEYFERTLETFSRLYDFKPDVIVSDLHPGYETTKWAKAYCAGHPGTELLQVQHHYAHALSCMAEYGIDEPVLAVCFDGTGFGDDGTLWGGEVLLADPNTYKRLFHLRPFRLIGGEKAVREPRRVALALLFECYTLDEVLQMKNPTTESFESAQIKTLHTMWRRGLNAPKSSSVGRLFDAVASLTGTAQILGYEGESGLLLEAEATGVTQVEDWALLVSEGVLDWEPLLRRLLDAPPAEAAAMGLHIALADAIAAIAREHPKKRVLLSGGVFQNRTLVNLTAARLRAAGIRYHIQSDVPVNDGGIALGQLYYGLFRRKE